MRDAAVVVTHPPQLERFHGLAGILIVHRLHAPLSVVLALWLVVLRVVGPPETRAQPEIGQFDVAVGSDENVIGLYVPVDEAHPVDGLDGAHQLGDVEEGEVLGEGAQLDEEAHHVSSGDVLHDKVEVLAVLEREEELHDPLIVSLGENVPLGLHVCDLVPPEDVDLPEGLHGVQLLRVGLTDEGDHTKRPQAERLDLIKHVVVQLCPFQPEEVGFLLVEDPPHLLRGRLVEVSLRHLHLQLHPPLLALLVGPEDVLDVLLDEKLERFRRDGGSLGCRLLLYPAVGELGAVWSELLRRAVGVHLTHGLVVVGGGERRGEGGVGGRVDLGWRGHVDVGAGLLRGRRGECRGRARLLRDGRRGSCGRRVVADVRFVLGL